MILRIAHPEDSDDTRSTPAAALAGALRSRATVRLHDRYIKEWEFGPQKVESDIMKAAKGADCLALVTKHSEYFSLDLEGIKKVMRTPVIVDGRNVFDAKVVEGKGFEYRSVGKAGIKRAR